MQGDPFGDFDNQEAVLRQLDEQAEKGGLGAVQEGLARLIGGANWQIRTKALTSARTIVSPKPVLLKAILDVALDDEAYTDSRILAVQALGTLVPRRSPAVGGNGLEPQVVINALQAQLATTEAPVLRLAQECAIKDIARSSIRLAG